VGADLREIARGLVAAREDGRIKLYLTSRALRCRRADPELFSDGEYLPLSTAGTKSDNLFAFARSTGSKLAIVAVPRLIAGLLYDHKQVPRGRKTWGKTQVILESDMRPVRWRNVFTGVVFTATEDRGEAPSLDAVDLFADFPVALLVGESA
jgi:(1->4)-alpha-D-glucan 1-alpha-D-glucosylmutase